MARAATASPEACTQPACLLRSDEGGSGLLAELVTRLISGEDFSGLVPRHRLITRRDRCLRCVRRVMRDGQPLPTVEMLAEIEAGKRAARRLRIGRRWSSGDFEF